MKRLAVLATFGLLLSSCSAGGGSAPGSGATPPLKPVPAGGSAGSVLSALPAHYTLVDLGAGVSPVRINNKNHIAGTDAQSVFFYDGSLHLLAPGSAADINDNDVIVGNNTNGGAVFHLDGSVTSLQAPAGYQFTSAFGINDSGRIAGDANAGCGNALAIYGTSGTGTVVESNGNAVQINNGGSIAYESFTSSGGCTQGDYSPMVYPGPQAISLSHVNPLECCGQATDINDNDDTVGYYASADQNGVFDGVATFLYHDGTTQEIDPPGGLDSTTKPQFQSEAINDENWIVGDVGSNAAPQRAYVWINGTFTDLNTRLPASCANWVLNVATDVNDNGYIVGMGTLNGMQHGFLLVPSP